MKRQGKNYQNPNKMTVNISDVLYGGLQKVVKATGKRQVDILREGIGLIVLSYLNQLKENKEELSDDR